MHLRRQPGIGQPVERHAGHRTQRRARAALLAVVALLGLAPVLAAPAEAATIRAIRFPVEGPVRFRPDFGAPRGGGTRSHAGNDIFGEKLQPIVSTSDGTVVRMGVSSGISGNYLVVRDGAGWEYLYIHLNNDTPGTDDGANPPAWRFAPAIGVGARVRAGQHLGWLGDSGNAEGEPPHLHFEIRTPSGTPIDPWASLVSAAGLAAGSFCDVDRNPAGRADPATAAGWWQAGADGGIFSSGGAPFHGSTPSEAVALAGAGSSGYWMADRAGGVAAHGVAHHGDLRGVRLNSPVQDLDATVARDGYWLLGGDGGVFSFGAARFHGSTGGIRLNRPVVGLAPTPTGQGYWLVASDGGIFTFGDAPFLGSTGAMRLNQPIVDVAPTPSGRGYWLLGRDGGVFAFGDAAGHGSVPGTGSCGPLEATTVVASPSGRGYWVSSTDGRVWAFGDATLFDTTAGQRIPTRIVDLVVVPLL